jgi:two-component system, cell cycle sensor histidine kinase and response regulator CckA
LPLVREKIPSAKCQTDLGKAPLGKETLLLVEDEQAVRAITRHVLQTCGYTILEAAHGAEAIKICEQNPGPIHLLVSDVVMPGMGGRQLAETLLSLRPEMKVLFLSGYTDDAVVRHGVLEAGTNFLQKPFTPASLAEKVREVLDLPRLPPSPPDTFV